MAITQLQSLKDSFYFLSQELQEKIAPFYVLEHVEKFIKNLYLLKEATNKDTLNSQPTFALECTPSIKIAFSHFEPLLASTSEVSPQKLALAIQKAGIANLLLLLGQRYTPASLKDEHAIPPQKEVLLQAVLKPYNAYLTLVAREWSKHALRSKELFWGTIVGNDAYKNKTSLAYIQKILNEATWWNMYGHFKHNTVYEVRIESGHGARWSSDGTVFIGFVEPFLDEELL